MKNNRYYIPPDARCALRNALYVVLGAILFGVLLSHALAAAGAL